MFLFFEECWKWKWFFFLWISLVILRPLSNSDINPGDSRLYWSFYWLREGFQKKTEESVTNEKYVFCFSPLQIFFCKSRSHFCYIYFLDLILSELYHSQSPQHSKTYLQCWETKPETHFMLCQSKETYFTSVKKAKQISSLGPKSCLTRKKVTNLIFFLDFERCMS